MKFLEQFPEFIKFRERESGRRKPRETTTEVDEKTPEEILEDAYEEIQDGLAQELLEMVKQSTPSFFERLVVELLVKMGYGGSRRDAARAVGQVGDEGIDGIIDEDRLGLDTIYIQAKKWAGGHKPVCVEFLHETNCMVQPVSSLANIQIERQGDKTILTIPPNPACDESRWLVSPAGGPGVEVTINVQRSWWCVGEENTPPSEWQDRPVVLCREGFQATSSKALWLRLPKRRWVDKVLVGFERSKARAYDVKVTEKTVTVPLREFGDCAEVGDQTQQHSLRLWIQRDNQEMGGFSLSFRP